MIKYWIVVYSEGEEVPRKKPVLYETEAGLLDSIYLEMSDSLRALRLDRIALEERVSEYTAVLKDLEAKNDPNRNMFHVATSNELSSECDNIRVKIHQAKEDMDRKDAEITELESRLEAIHTARKMMLKAKLKEEDKDVSQEAQGNTVVTPAANEALAFCPEEQSPKEPGEKLEFSKSDKAFARRKLNSCVDRLELASRVTGFDPERARVELNEAISIIKEVLSVF